MSESDDLMRIMRLFPPFSVLGLIGLVGNAVMAIFSLIVIARFLETQSWAWVVVVYGIVLTLYFGVTAVISLLSMRVALARGRIRSMTQYFDTAQSSVAALGYGIVSIMALVFLLPKTVADLGHPLNHASNVVLLGAYIAVALVSSANGPLNFVGHANRLKRILADEAILQDKV